MVIWCISKYAMPPKYGAQQRLFMLSNQFNKTNNKSYVITCSNNHLADLPYQKQTFRITEEYGSSTIFIKSVRVGKSTSLMRIVSWFIFEINLFRFNLKFKQFKIDKPDFVLVSSLSLMTILNGLYLKYRYKAKLIFEIRDIWPLTAILITKKSKYNPLILFLSWIEKTGYKHADLISSPLPNLPEHISNTIKNKFDFLYVPQGFEIIANTQSDELDGEFINKYIPENKFIVGYIGNIVEAYDLISLVNCAKYLHDRNEMIHFVILGDGVFKPKLMQLANKLSNISFAPRIPKRKVQSFLKHCNIMTNFLKDEPLFRYGVSPQKLIDYMQASKPIVMSYSGFPSIVKESGCGFEIEAGNVKLLSEKFIELSEMKSDDLNLLGKNGKDYLEKNLHWNNIASRYLDFFKKMQ